MKIVLIICYSFPPLNNIAARRFGWMSAFFEENGWKPYILTTNSNGPLSVNISEDRCFRIGTHPQAQAKIDDEYYKWKSDVNSLVNLARKLTTVRLHSYDASAFGWNTVVRKELDGLLKKLPHLDMIIGSYGPSAAHLIARELSSKLNVPWIADYRDLAAFRDSGRRGFISWFDKKLEQRIVRSASGVTSVSNTWKNELMDVHDKPGATVYNGFYPDKAGMQGSQNKVKREAVGSGESYLHHAGRLYPRRMESMELLFKAMAKYSDIRLIFRSLGPASLEREVLLLAKQAGVSQQLELLPPVSPDVLKKEQEKALANVVLEESSLQNRITTGMLTGKFLQLLPGSVPILSICRSDNEMAEILKDTARGMCCSTVKQVEEFLGQAVDQPDSFHGKSEKVNEYNYRDQAKRMCRFMNSILKKTE